MFHGTNKHLVIMDMFNGRSISDFLTENVIVVLVIAVAAVVLTFAFSGKVRQAAMALGIVLIAFFLVGASTHSDDVGGWLYGLIS